MGKIIVLLIATLFIFTSSCQSIRKKIAEKKLGNKKITWLRHPNQKGNLAGFKIYLGMGGGMKDKLLADIRNPEATEASMAAFKDKLNYYKANYIYLTAYDHNENESKPSKVMCWGRECKKKK